MANREFQGGCRVRNGRLGQQWVKPDLIREKKSWERDSIYLLAPALMGDPFVIRERCALGVGGGELKVDG